MTEPKVWHSFNVILIIPGMLVYLKVSSKKKPVHFIKNMGPSIKQMELSSLGF